LVVAVVLRQQKPTLPLGASMPVSIHPVTPIDQS
jgi:hypothetical protein